MASPRDRLSTYATRGTMTGQQVRDVYAEVPTGLLAIQNALRNYEVQKTYDVISYEGHYILPVTGDPILVPRINLVGFSDAQVAIMDRGWSELFKSIEQGTLNGSTYTALLQLVASSGEQIYFISDGSTAHIGNLTAGGQTYSNGVPGRTMDGQLEISLNVGNTAGPYGTIELLENMFHEPLHDQFVHSFVDPSRGVAGNLERITADTIAADYAYANGESIVRLIAPLVDPKITTDQIDHFYRGGYSTEDRSTGTRARVEGLYDTAAKFYNNARIKYLNATLDAHKDNLASLGLTAEQLMSLKEQGFLELRRMPADLTPEQQRTWGTHAEDYTVERVRVSAFVEDEDGIRFAVVAPTSVDAGDGLLESLFTDALQEIRDFFAEYSSEIGASLGTQLGRLIFDGQLEGTLGSVVFGALGRDIGQTLENSLNGMSLESAAGKAFANLPADVRNAGLGAMALS